MPFQSRFKISLLAYTLLTLAACGGGGSTSAPNTEGNQGDGTQLGSGSSDSNVDNDSDGVDDASEEPQDSVAPFLEQRPLMPVVITTNYHLIEDFSDISSGDAPLTEELFSQLVTKQHLNASLSTVAFGGDDAKFRSSTHSLYYKVNIDLSLSDMFCDSYQLGVTHTRGDWWGNRYYTLTRAEDGLVIEPQLDISAVDTPATQWYNIDRLDSRTETLQLVGYKAEFFRVEVKAECDLLDSDNDGLADVRETLIGSNPDMQDSDSDGLLDGSEARWGLDPLSSLDGAYEDADDDGMSNAEEVSRGIGPFGYAPEIQNLAFARVPAVGEELSLNYFFYDRDFSNEGSSEVVWQVGDVTFDQRRYTPAEADIGRLISACVTPVSAKGTPARGEQVCTDSYSVLPTAERWDGLGPVTLTGRHDGEGVDLVVLGDGFTEEEAAKFKQTVLNFVEKYLSFHEIAIHQSAWNIHAVGVVSNESGVTDRSVEPAIEKDTYFESCKGCSSASRVVSANGTIAKGVAAEHFPQYDAVLVLVNSTKYGGVAGGVATSTATPTSIGVSIHELGHSFGGLADEYGGSSEPRTTEPGNANITINNDLETVKWRHWLEPTAHLTEGEGKVGLYEGGNYRNSGVWRPTINSQMNSAGSNPFHAVNSEAWALRVYSKAKPVHTAIPDTTQMYFHSRNELALFSVESVHEFGIQKVDWYVDGVLMASSPDKQFRIPYFKQGSYEVVAVVTDQSGTILKDVDNYSSTEIHWQVTAQ